MKLPLRKITLRSAELRHPDLAAIERFFAGPWGLEIVAREGGKLYFAGTGEDFFCLVVSEGPRAQMACITFRVDSVAALQAIRADALKAGATLAEDIGPSADPAGGTAFSIYDPFGRRIQFVADDLRVTGRAPARDRPVGLTHVNLNASDMDGSRNFFERGLGMVMSDRNAHHIFMNCNRDHHTIVFANNGVDTLNHVAFLMPDLEGVMLRTGLLRDAGHPIGWGVGRHGPGSNVFAYFQSPFEFVVEVTSEIEQVDESYRVGAPEDWVWPSGRSDRWGIADAPSAELREAQKRVPYAVPLPERGRAS